MAKGQAAARMDGGKGSWQAVKRVGVRRVEDRHEALSIFFDMKVTVRGSGEEEGLEK